MSKELSMQDARRLFARRLLMCWLIFSLIFAWISIGLTVWLAATSTGTIEVLALLIPGIFAGISFFALANVPYLMYCAWVRQKLNER